MILIVYGTRPEYIKISPLVGEMTKRGIPFKTLFTGQHKDIAPDDADYNMVMKDYGTNRLDSVIQNCMNLPDKYFDGVTHMLVQGDTTSVTGLALSALHRKIKLIHLEAGLRSGDYNNPYPEENNRRMVSTIASIHLCPTELNKGNLLNENIYGDIHVVGNTVLDNLQPYKSECEYQNKVLVTMHRRENHHNMDEWFKSINELAIKYSDYEFVLPIHPNPNVQKHKDLLTNVKIVEPLGHKDLIMSLIKCKLIITDSGGLQEECSFFNKKCLVCRKVTERPESVGLTSFMVQGPEDLSGLFEEHLNNHEVNVESPYGDGNSSSRICDIFKDI